MNHAISLPVKNIMTTEERYDEAMFDYTRGDYPAALGKLAALVGDAPDFYDARLSLAMCHYRMGNIKAAIEEGHRAEQLRPTDPLAHTNLSLFYMKAGDKVKAEHHIAQARMASWREALTGSTTSNPPIPPPSAPPIP